MDNFVFTAILIISIIMVIVLIRYFLYTRTVEYNKDFAIEMIRYCANSYVGTSFGSSFYTKSGYISEKAKRNISQKKEELLLFYNAPKTHSKFVEHLVKKKLMNSNGEIYVRDKETVYEEFLYFYENFKNNLRSNLKSFIRVEHFFLMKKDIVDDYVGVYILYNSTKNKYYVGQAKRIFYRVNQHFTGHGNGDVYADYKYGDVFYVRLIKMSESQFESIDRLERHYIELYGAEEFGYNKTIGNSY